MKYQSISELLTGSINVRISVKDEGIGVLAEDMETLFKPFPNIEHEYITGHSVVLGLSISKGIIELHGGSI